MSFSSDHLPFDLSCVQPNFGSRLCNQASASWKCKFHMGMCVSQTVLHICYSSWLFVSRLLIGHRRMMPRIAFAKRLSTLINLISKTNDKCDNDGRYGCTQVPIHHPPLCTSMYRVCGEKGRRIPGSFIECTANESTIGHWFSLLQLAYRFIQKLYWVEDYTG